MTTTNDPVLVEWVDAHSDAHGWTEQDELDPEPRIVVSVGMVLRNVKPNHLTVAQSMDDGVVDSVLSIPTSCIKRVVRLIEGLSLPLEPQA